MSATAAAEFADGGDVGAVEHGEERCGKGHEALVILLDVRGAAAWAFVAGCGAGRACVVVEEEAHGVLALPLIELGTRI